jgi:hypothetical protein
MKTEHEDQRELVRWFRQTHVGTVIFAIPNGGARSLATASRLKAEGVVKGVPDLFIPAWELWVEMKRVKGGAVSQEQETMHAYLRGVGYWVLVAKGFEDAKQQIEAWKNEVE